MSFSWTLCSNIKIEIKHQNHDSFFASIQCRVLFFANKNNLVYLVACRFELASSKSGSGDGANDRDVFVTPAVKLDDVLFLSISIKSPM